MVEVVVRIGTSCETCSSSNGSFNNNHLRILSTKGARKASLVLNGKNDKLSIKPMPVIGEIGM